MWELPVFVFFGNYFVWLLLSAAIVISLVALVENDQAGKATTEIIVTVLFLQFMTTLRPISYVFEHPFNSFLFLLAYIAAGAVWGWCRWGLFVHGIADDYSEFRDRYVKQNGTPIDQMTPMQRKSMLASVRNEFEFDIPCVVSQHKSRITTWMTYWPFSALWTVLNDPLRRIYRWILATMHGSLQALSTRAFATYRNDFE